MATTVTLQINAAGRFEAAAPFDQVVNVANYYTVQALRNFHEMEALKVDIYTLVFAPVGVAAADYPAVLARAKAAGAVVASLMDNTDTPVYVVTSYLTSFPLVDGVSYERMCLIADLGPVPPTMATTVAQVQSHMADYILEVIGISSTVKLGTIPTIGYVSADQAAAYEATRLSKISDGASDQAKIKTLTTTLASRDAQIAELEAKVIALSK